MRVLFILARVYPCVRLYICAVNHGCVHVCATAFTRLQIDVSVLFLWLTLQLSLVHRSDECCEIRRQLETAQFMC